MFNDALRLRQERYQTTQQTISSTERQKQLITQAKHTVKRCWLAEVSNIALQQSIQDACLAFKNFFQSLKGQRQGQKVGFPRFKRKRNTQAFRLTRGGFAIRNNGKLYLVKSRSMFVPGRACTVVQNTIAISMQRSISRMSRRDTPRL